ncbi:hypothetical protein BV898_17609 [Hypsibius exemplaris]|uniref:Uncharacterized protein n=1 Tax=Hypsibius exemplaris TaxID=2072580 RepID=A0A9X6NFF2_HYPEX|nr:hypothetical protein BV898_17609 [Hypsibius exemplaris]
MRLSVEFPLVLFCVANLALLVKAAPTHLAGNWITLGESSPSHIEIHDFNGETRRHKRSSEATAAATGPAELLKTLQQIKQMIDMFKGAEPADTAPPAQGSGADPAAPPAPADAPPAGGGLDIAKMLQFMQMMQTLQGGAGAGAES